MWSSLAILALLASAQGRAVNISNTWVLPEEGFPVFYRYFRDHISWYEADAVCQFHHANLVTVDTTAQYDAVRAYLKELDISSAVWVGLIRSNPDGDFTWTDYRGLSGDGYWSTAPDTRSAPLCAAADPAADYRWEARACGGPTVASFICELPVPQWALGNEGCMVKELPALTILYLPESAAVQLNADCGLAGVKRVQCTGNVKREGLLKDLSCADEENMSSSPMPTSMSTYWPATTDSTGEDTTNEATTEEITTTEHTVDVNQPIVITATSLPEYINSKYTNRDKINTVLFNKHVNLGESDDHNIQSNFIPKLVEVGNVLTNEQLDKLEDERHMQHKMLHEEIARVGNVDNIFTQPTDHFIPPLVMAKSRMSDDMTVLSLAEKHAQQIAEKQFGKHSQIDNLDIESNNHRLSLDNAQVDKPLITSVKPNKIKDAKKENLKSHVPKKYVNEKYYETKSKVAKTWETKTTELATEATQTPTTIHDLGTTTTTKDSTHPGQADDDFGMDLTVMLRDASFTSEEQEKYSNKYLGDVVKLETITKKQLPATNQLSEDNSMIDPTTDTNMKSLDNSTVKHEVIKITVISNTNPGINTSVFEITTKMPIFKDDTIDDSKQVTTNPTTSRPGQNLEINNVEQVTTNPTTSKPGQNLEITNVDTTKCTPKVDYIESNNEEASTAPAVVTSKPESTNLTSIVVTSSVNIATGTTAMPLFENKTELTEISTTKKTTAMFNTGEKVTDAVNNKITTDEISTEKHDTISTDSYEPMEKDDFNNTDIHDQLEQAMNETEEIDENSPLLSGAYEPIHRPPRTRTPQQQNRKFNPFRILG